MEVCVCIAITTNKTQGVAMTRLLNQLSEIKTYTPKLYKVSQVPFAVEMLLHL